MIAFRSEYISFKNIYALRTEAGRCNSRSNTNHIFAEMTDSAFAVITVAAKFVRVNAHPVTDAYFFYAIADGFGIFSILKSFFE